MADYNLSSNSLNKVRRWYDARRAAGIQVQPWELEAAYKAELDALNNKSLQSRSLSIQEKNAADALAERSREFDATMAQREADRAASERAGKTQALTSLGTTGAGLWYLGSRGKPTGKEGEVGNSLWNTAKEYGGKAYDYVFNTPASTVATDAAATPLAFSGTTATPATVAPYEYSSTFLEATPTTPAWYGTTTTAATPVATGEAIAGGTAGVGAIGGGLTTASAPGAGTAMSTGELAGSSSAGTYVPYIAGTIAADLARSKWGETDKPYEERGPLGKLTSSGGLGVISSGLQAMGVNPSNAIAKPFEAIGKAGEDVVMKPVHDILQFKPVEAVKDFVTGTVNSVGNVFNSIGIKCCIVYGYYYGTTSLQARTAKRFCGKYVTLSQLLGYYQIGLIVIHLAEISPRFKAAWEKTWCIPMYKTMAEMVRYIQPPRWRRLYMKAFLALCSAVYYAVPRPYIPPGTRECIEMAQDNTRKKMEVQHAV